MLAYSSANMASISSSVRVTWQPAAPAPRACLSARCSSTPARAIQHLCRVSGVSCRAHGGSERRVARSCALSDPGRRDLASEASTSRVLLKLSGEALSGEREWSIDPGTMSRVAGEIAAAVRQGVQVAVVVGGGNFFRGADRWPGLERASADHVGMLATVMNALCLQSALEEAGVSTRVQTAIPMQGMAEPYIRRRAIRHLERGRVVIFGAGVGSPYFTTDTAAALRAAEIGARSVLKATVVEGIFDADPEVAPGASLLRSLAFADVIQRRLCVMDQTAVTLCFENDIPIHVFSLAQAGNLLRALGGDRSIGTLVSAEGGEKAAARVAASDPAGDEGRRGDEAALAAKNGDAEGRPLASPRGPLQNFAPSSSL